LEGDTREFVPGLRQDLQEDRHPPERLSVAGYLRCDPKTKSHFAGFVAPSIIFLNIDLIYLRALKSKIIVVLTYVCKKKISI
jgi:hypothetical protein